jgi:hypothetical protein
MQTDRRTDVTKLIVAFRNFSKAPKNCGNICNYLICLYMNYERFSGPVVSNVEGMF